MNIVVLGHYRPGYRLAYYEDWRDAFLALSPRHDVRVLDTFRPVWSQHPLFERLPARWFLPARELRELFEGSIPCDVLVVAPSFYYFHGGHRRDFVTCLAQRGAKRFQILFFMENEYRLLAEKVALAKELRSDVLVSQLPQDVAERFYGQVFPGRVVSCPAGLNPSVFRPGPPMEGRRIDVGTRNHPYPASLGDDERNAILATFQRGDAKLRDLTIDISTDGRRRLPRGEWAAFLGRCRSTLGTEAGSATLSWGEGPSFSGKCVSSRHFEAAGTKTAQIMYSGRFNDIFRANEHYIELRRDNANLQEVVDAIKDDAALTRLASAAYEHVLSGHTYAHRVAHLLRHV